MVKYLLLVQFLVLASVYAKPRFDFFSEFLEQNDANLPSGFDLDAFRQNVLDEHNYYRALHGVPSMTKDDTLTSEAQAFAERLAELDSAELEHCSDMPDCVITKESGENLYKGGTAPDINPTKSWYDEIWFYNFCNGGKRPGYEGEMVKHFTQVVWKSSIELGIGYAVNSAGTASYVVARYHPPGNYGGQFTTEVLEPDHIVSRYQDNCDGTNGTYTDWVLGPCSRSCGGGISFNTRTCTNPKPSINGKDCEGPTEELSLEWCNIPVCPGDKSYRDTQCGARLHR